MEFAESVSISAPEPPLHSVSWGDLTPPYDTLTPALWPGCVSSDTGSHQLSEPGGPQNQTSAWAWLVTVPRCPPRGHQIPPQGGAPPLPLCLHPLVTGSKLLRAGMWGNEPIWSLLSGWQERGN